VADPSPVAVASERGLAALFSPRSVAVLGASSKPEKHGYRLVNNLRSLQSGVAVYPITRTPGPILGHESYRSVAELPEAPDLVLVSVPAEVVPEAIAEAAAAGARSAVVFACGFSEAGAAGRDLQERMLAGARPAGLRVVGPNCMGVCNLDEGLYGTYFTNLPTDAGSVGFVSQSGGFGGTAFKELFALGVGISKFASIGNMSDVTHAELIRYLGDDEPTRVVAAFVEGVPNGADLLDAVAEVSAVKPVVVLKGARTKSGQVAAASHTGSLAAEGRVWEALLREAGALVAEDSDDLFDTAATLVRCEGRLPRGRRTAIATVSGGPSVIGADACDDYGLELPPLDEQLEHARALVPDFASFGNPVDFTSQTPRPNYAPAVAAVAAVPEVDSLLAINVGFDAPEFAEAFVAVWEQGDKPVVGYLVGEKIEAIFADHGIPNLPSTERAVRAARRLWDRARSQERASAVSRGVRFRFEPASGLGDGAMDEHAAKRLLADHGIPVTREAPVTDVAGAVAAAGEIGYPVALKLLSETVLHKTDAGGVVLGLRNADELEQAFAQFAERFPGESLLVQEMVPGGVELIVGARRDPQAGPIVMLGIGGVFVELLEDVVFARASLGPTRAVELVDELRAQRLLDGFRGAEPVNRAALAEVVERLGALLVANAEIAEIDLNPVIASGGTVTVADALIRCEPGD
jgi:acyl-CoA synthetase (NDP forming)